MHVLGTYANFKCFIGLTKYCIIYFREYDLVYAVVIVNLKQVPAILFGQKIRSWNHIISFINLLQAV